MYHEIFVTDEAASLLGQTPSAVKIDAHDLCNKICDEKDWTRGLSVMVAARDGQGGERTVFFVINQVLDTQHKAFSTDDIRTNTPSLNSDAHCLMTVKGNGPNKYAGFKRLRSQLRTGTINRRIV